jgi:hypothetical protein
MKLIRAMFLLLAVCLPTSWTLAHAEDAPPADAAKEAKPKKKSKKKEKKEEAPKPEEAK